MGQSEAICKRAHLVSSLTPPTRLTAQREHDEDVRGQLQADLNRVESYLQEGQHAEKRAKLVAQLKVGAQRSKAPTLAPSVHMSCANASWISLSSLPQTSPRVR
jgi:hypothetical protein